MSEEAVPLEYQGIANDPRAWAWEQFRYRRVNDIFRTYGGGQPGLLDFRRFAHEAFKAGYDAATADLHTQLALVTDERDKAIERSAIFERAVDEIQKRSTCQDCDSDWMLRAGDDCPICGQILYPRESADLIDIAVKAKKDAEEVG